MSHNIIIVEPCSFKFIMNKQELEELKNNVITIPDKICAKIFSGAYKKYNDDNNNAYVFGMLFPLEEYNFEHYIRTNNSMIAFVDYEELKNLNVKELKETKEVKELKELKEIKESKEMKEDKIKKINDKYFDKCDDLFMDLSFGNMNNSEQISDISTTLKEIRKINPSIIWIGVTINTNANVYFFVHRNTANEIDSIIVDNDYFFYTDNDKVKIKESSWY